MSIPYTDSRRLTGPNLYFTSAGAALETAIAEPVDDALLQRWRHNLCDLRQALHWPQADVVLRRHASGVSLAFAAPPDQLYAAVAGNEWAWCDALDLPVASDMPALDGVSDRAQALQVLQQLAAKEARPAAVALLQAAQAHGLPCLLDEEALSIGSGIGARIWPVQALPAVQDVPWTDLHAIPTALVTGSNGKTTTVRLIAAMARVAGLVTAHSCTDGIYIDNVLAEGGDYSGPGGARAVLRQPQTQAAVLETARGGLLRRGVEVTGAQAAVITNLSEDHFGEYGIHDLYGLAEAKLLVRHALSDAGWLVLNADDARVRRAGVASQRRVAWFALDAAAIPSDGVATCHVRDGHLLLRHAGVVHDLGAVAAMPLTLDGHARYNIANLAAAALAATAMGIPAQAIANTCTTFGTAPEDNEGRMHRCQLGGVEVVIDYANNADGLQQVLQAADTARGKGRLAVMLGHAGNRADADYRALARIAVDNGADLCLLRRHDDYLRGREPGAVAAVIADELQRLTGDAQRWRIDADEVESVRAALAWARSGDLLLLVVHSHDARLQAIALLQRLQRDGWMPGQPLPPRENAIPHD